MTGESMKLLCEDKEALFGRCGDTEWRRDKQVMVSVLKMLPWSVLR